MEANKEIKVYGTLKNWTVDDNKKGVDPISGAHYDAVAYADQLYDKWFGESTPVNNFQDVINRRLSAIQYGEGTTTIKNRTGVTPSSNNPYVLKVVGPTNIQGDIYCDGTIYVKRNGQWVPFDLTQILNDIAELKSLWKKEGTSLVPVDSSRSVKAFGFYDTDPQMI